MWGKRNIRNIRTINLKNRNISKAQCRSWLKNRLQCIARWMPRWSFQKVKQNSTEMFWRGNECVLLSCLRDGNPHCRGSVDDTSLYELSQEIRRLEHTSNSHRAKSDWHLHKTISSLCEEMAGTRIGSERRSCCKQSLPEVFRLKNFTKKQLAAIPWRRIVCCCHLWGMGPSCPTVQQKQTHWEQGIANIPTGLDTIWSSLHLCIWTSRRRAWGTKYLGLSS